MNTFLEGFSYVGLAVSLLLLGFGVVGLLFKLVGLIGGEDDQ